MPETMNIVNSNTPARGPGMNDAFEDYAWSAEAEPAPAGGRSPPVGAVCIVLAAHT